jgi:hypothetical protein
VEVLDKLNGVLQPKSVKRVEWQSLVGTLSFLCQVVVPGRAFMSRLCRKLAGKKFWVHLDKSSREDLVAWRGFVADRMFRPFPMVCQVSAPLFHLLTDAASTKGFGAVLGSSWFFGSWGDSWWSGQNIMLLELYLIWAALKLWECRFRDCWLVLHTDNAALVPVLGKFTSKLHYANAMLREISLLSMRSNVVLLPEHVPGRDNVMADLLSRLQVDRFLMLAGRGVEESPCHLEGHMLPGSCRDMLMRF